MPTTDNEPIQIYNDGKEWMVFVGPGTIRGYATDAQEARVEALRAYYRYHLIVADQVIQSLNQETDTNAD